MTPTRNLLMTLTAVALTVAACSSSSSGGDLTAGTTAAPPPSTVPASTTTTTAPPAAEIDVGDLPPGSYSSDLLGTEVTLTTTTPWFVPVAQETIVILEAPDPPAPETRAVLLARPTGFLSQADVRTGYVDVTGPTGDIDAWIALVGFEVASRSTGEVGGRPAEVISGTIPDPLAETLLRTNAPVPFNGTPDGDYLYVRGTNTYRLWLVDQGDLDPIVVMAIALEGDEGWFTVADDLVADVALGEPEPHPRPAEAVDRTAPCTEGLVDVTGVVESPLFGGVRFTATRPVDVMGVARHPRMEIYDPAAPELFVVGVHIVGPLPADSDYPDAATATAHVLREATSARTIELAGFDTTSVGHIGARSDGGGWLADVEVDGDFSSIGVGMAFWFFDTPDGVFLVRAYPDANGDLEPAIALAQEVLPTMNLVSGLCG